MPQYTSRHRIPYPLASERVADYPTTARQAAERIDTLLGTQQTLTPQSAFSGSTLRLTQVGNTVTLEGIVRQGTANTPLEAGRTYTVGTLAAGTFPSKAIHGETAIFPAISYVAGSSSPHTAEAVLMINPGTGDIAIRCARRTTWLHVSATWSAS